MPQAVQKIQRTEGEKLKHSVSDCDVSRFPAESTLGCDHPTYLLEPHTRNMGQLLLVQAEWRAYTSRRNAIAKTWAGVRRSEPGQRKRRRVLYMLPV